MGNIILNKYSKTKNTDGGIKIYTRRKSLPNMKKIHVISINEKNQEFYHLSETEKLKDEPVYIKKSHINNLMKKSEKYFGIKFTRFIEKHLCNKTDLYLLSVNFISIFFYLLGLTPCERDASECTIKRGMKFYIIVGILTLISAILVSFYISFTFYYKKHFFHYIYMLPIYFSLIASNTGTDGKEHGLYNSLGFLLFLIIVGPLFYLLFIILKLIILRRFKSLFYLLLTITVILIIYNSIPGFSCKNWDLGLNNTRIDNDINKYPCHILLPGKNKCYLQKMDDMFDFSKIFRPSCSADSILNNEKKIFLKKIGKKYNSISKLNHFGYPLTTVQKFNLYNTRDLKEFQELVNNSTIRMDVFNEKNYPGEKYPEVELFFDEKNHGTIKINVTRNETLSKERKNIAQNKHSLYNNVFILYIDAISRNQFKRRFTKLASLIEPFMKYNIIESEKEFSAFQFMKYNTLKGLTLPNIKSMFYGIPLKENAGLNFVKYYKQQGFVTGHTGTTCGKEIFSVNNLLLSQELDYDMWDHENIAMFCDPNFFDYRYPINRGVASVLKRCLYGKYAFEYMIEYTKQFWQLYPDNKKLFRIHFNEGHDGTMSLVKYLVDPLYEFVKTFFVNHWLDDTFVFVVSDHGNHILGPFAILRPKDYLLESTLATLFFIIPNKKKIYENGLYDNIYNNQQVFITPYDIHDTLIHIAYGDEDTPPKQAYSGHGSSLLEKIDPMDRYCENKKFDLGISKGDCKCKKYKKIIKGK